MKTAISIPDDLFLTIKKMAQKQKVSRSQFITHAVRDFIAKQNNRELLETLNKVYSENDSTQEIELRKKTKKHYSKLCEREKW